MMVTLRGRRYDLRFVPLRTNDGECDPPNKPSKQIRIKSTLQGHHELDTIVHELLHACHWDLDEAAIDHTANDIARVLWRLGYRKEQ